MIGHAPGATVALRPANPEDESLLQAIALSARADALPGLDGEVLAMQASVVRRARAGRVPPADEELVLVDGEPVGAIATARTPGVLELIDIALLPRWRRRGIGTAVLDRLFTVADDERRTVRARVYHTNPRAHALYRRLGFVDVDRDELSWMIERRSASAAS